MPFSCALLGVFAVGAQVVLPWQRNANAKCQLVHACTPCLYSLYAWFLRLVGMTHVNDGSHSFMCHPHV